MVQPLNFALASTLAIIFAAFPLKSSPGTLEEISSVYPYRKFGALAWLHQAYRLDSKFDFAA